MKEKWWKRSVVYQIYPRSFMDANGDGIGDLKGITSRLDYLKELGIDVIWLSPIYQSPNDDNGYDISDYRNIMTEFGTMEDFDEMLSEAHKRGLKIVMDLVVNHSSDEHKWFVESRKSKDNPYRDYYIWMDGKDGNKQPPNNWGSCFSGPAWQYDETTDMYYLHLFSKKQPDLNWDNPKVRDEVFDMMDWWCQKGIDGFRMDVICMISKTKEKPDGPVADGALYGDFSPYSIHGPNVHKYLQEMRERVLSKYNLITVGETPGVTIEEAEKYAGEDEKELNMVFHFDHVSISTGATKWDLSPVPLVEFKKIMTKWQVGLYGRAWNSLYLSNHDQPRCVSRFGNDDPKWRVLSAKMLGTCMHMMQGTPYVYQGEELGMTNYPFTKLEEFRDIEAINAYHEMVEESGWDAKHMIECLRYKGRDNARTPMQWDDTANGGFSKGTPWIAVNPNYKEVNAKAAMEDPDSVFRYYQKLIKLRKEYDIVTDGKYELLMPESESVYAYTRKNDQNTMLVLCNFTDAEQAFSVPAELTENAKVLISNYNREAFAGKTVLAPYEAIVLYK